MTAWNLTFEVFTKHIEEIQVSLKSDKNDGMKFDIW